MSRFRHLAALSVLAFALAALLSAPGAFAAEGIGPAKKLGGSTETTTVTTSASRTKTTGTAAGSTKEALSIATGSPADGATVSGQVAWQVAVLEGAPSKVEFAVDGVAKWTDTSAPFTYGADAGSLDTTRLGNGSHTLSATAYGAKGAKAATKVTVTVANKAPESGPAPEPEPAPAPAPAPQPGGGPLYWGATIGS